eukprot:COSAG05_NODE_7223_length_841_cov_0.777628_2_plen_21_part_01
MIAFTHTMQSCAYVLALIFEC